MEDNFFTTSHLLTSAPTGNTRQFRKVDEVPDNDESTLFSPFAFLREVGRALFVQHP